MNGNAWSRVPLAFAGTTSLFETDLEVTEPGTYEVSVSVYGPRTGNTGVDTTVFKMVR